MAQVSVQTTIKASAEEGELPQYPPSVYASRRSRGKAPVYVRHPFRDTVSHRMGERFYGFHP